MSSTITLSGSLSRSTLTPPASNLSATHRAKHVLPEPVLPSKRIVTCLILSSSHPPKTEAVEAVLPIEPDGGGGIPTIMRTVQLRHPPNICRGSFQLPTDCLVYQRLPILSVLNIHSTIH